MKNVLLVEDDEDIRDCLLEGIESSMYNVFSARDGIDGLDKIKSLEIDLVITDYRMPRMNGVTFSTKLKQLYPAIPVILISTFCPKDLGIQDLIHTFIPKPFDPEVLKVRIESILMMEVTGT